MIESQTAETGTLGVYGKGISTNSRLIDQAVSGIREFMGADGMAIIYQRSIASTCGTVYCGVALWMNRAR